MTSWAPCPSGFPSCRSLELMDGKDAIGLKVPSCGQNGLFVPDGRRHGSPLFSWQPPSLQGPSFLASCCHRHTGTTSGTWPISLTFVATRASAPSGVSVQRLQKENVSAARRTSISCSFGLNSCNFCPGLAAWPHQPERSSRSDEGGLQ